MVTCVTPAGAAKALIRHVAIPSALPDWPRSVVQETVRVPKPPLAVPVRSTVAADATTAACVVIVTGAGGPVGVAGVAPEPDPDGEPGIGGGVKPGAIAPGEPEPGGTTGDTLDCAAYSV